jgi:oxamate amidohydrolase
MTLYNKIQNGGMAVAPHAKAAESAAAILAAGGNAIEASVAMAATLAAVYPHMTGLGGDSFWLIHEPDGTVQSVLGCGRSAMAATTELYTSAGLNEIPIRGGMAANTVAGTVSGWEAALEISTQQWQGKLPLSQLLADAIDYCRNGFTVTESQVISTSSKLEQLQHQPGFAEVFLLDGTPPIAGRSMTQPALANTLERLASVGLNDFYQGELAADIAKELVLCGSPLSLQDLQTHQAQLAKPLYSRINKADVYVTPPPTQGLATLLILAQFARRPGNLAEQEDADMVHYLVEATKQAFSIRNKIVRDPALMWSPAQKLLDDDLLEAMAARIDITQSQSWTEAMSPADTTWFGVIDTEGRAVSCIQSIYHEFGSGVVLPTTGLCWQNRGVSFSLQAGHPLELTPKTLPFHTLCPSMAHFDDGRRMVFGTMGGDGQPQTQAIVFTRYADYGMRLDEAISAPRWLQGRTWGDHSNNLKMESRFDPALVKELRNRGHDVALIDDYNESMGHAGAIVRHADGRIEGASDPRSDGAAVGI